MGKLKKQERVVVEAVARRFSATWEERGDSSEANLTIAGKRVSLQIAAMKERRGGQAGRARPHLRFDKVAVRLVEHLQAALREAVPGGAMVLLAITAPIRLAAKTAVALEERTRVLLARRSVGAEEKAKIHGNRIRIRIEKTSSRPASKVIGFVHNPDTDPRILFDMTRSLLEFLCVRAHANATKKFAGDRWLVVMSQLGPSHMDTCRYVCSQLGVPASFEKILMVFGDGRVETLK
jgi:hypothetical protein